MKSNIKTVFITVIGMIAILLITSVVFFLWQTSKKWNEINFAWRHPNLVLALKENYASESAKLEQKFLVREQSADDKLKEALANELEQSKP